MLSGLNKNPQKKGCFPSAAPRATYPHLLISTVFLRHLHRTQCRWFARVGRLREHSTGYRHISLTIDIPNPGIPNLEVVDIQTTPFFSRRFCCTGRWHSISIYSPVHLTGPDGSRIQACGIAIAIFLSNPAYYVLPNLSFIST